MRSVGELVGAVFLIVGVLALLGTLGGSIGLVDSLRWFWPLLVIGLGLWLVVVASDRRRAPPPVNWGGPSGGAGATAAPGGAGARPISQSAAGVPSAGGQPGGGAAEAGNVSGAPSGWAAQPGAWGASPHAWAPGGVHEQRVLGSIELAGPSQGTPMRVETLVGEIRLDLSRTTFPAGETAVHVAATIGDVRVLLPPDVAVAVRASSLLGHNEALGRRSVGLLGEVRAESEGFATATRRVRVEAQSLLGEVAVRRARMDSAAAPERRAADLGTPPEPSAPPPGTAPPPPPI